MSARANGVDVRVVVLFIALFADFILMGGFFNAVINGPVWVAVFLGILTALMFTTVLGAALYMHRQDQRRSQP